MMILTVSGLNVLRLVLAQGPVSRLTVNNPSSNSLEQINLGTITDLYPSHVFTCEGYMSVICCDVSVLFVDR